MKEHFIKLYRIHSGQVFFETQTVKSLLL